MSKIKNWFKDLDWFTAIVITACVVIFCVSGALGYGMIGEWWAFPLVGGLVLLALSIIVLLVFIFDTNWNK